LVDDKVENPYKDMDAKTLGTHLEQLSSVVKGTEIDVKQYFGIADASISDADQTKIDQHASLTSEVSKLTAEASAKDLSPEAVATTQVGIDGLLSQIKSIDSDVDVSTIGSKFNNLERMSILNDVKPLIEKYVAQIATIKKEIGNKDSTENGTQTFSSPKGTETAASIIESMNKKD